MEITVPSVGESITEVFIGEWYVGEGDTITQDGDVVGLETDKATFDVPAPTSGRITKVLKQAGDTAQVGEVIAHIEPGEVEASSNGQAASSGGDAPKADVAPSSKPAPTGDREVGGSGGHVMPAAARVMAEKGLTSVEGTGPGGRVLKEDALRATGNSGGASGGGGGRETKTVPMSPIRQTIARRLVEAQTNAALLTTFNEIDMTAVMAVRKQYQDQFVKRYDVKLGFMSFFVKAVCEALNVFPAVGAEVSEDGKSLIHRNYCDVGVAIGGGKGLVVPVLRNAERMGFAEIEQAIGELAGRAKKNQIELSEMEGGNFTITNGGIYGSLLSTPIVNPPQSGVLGMHNIVQRPVVVDGQVVARPMMYVALTYDHRVVDGREAVQFLVRIKDCIEDPLRLAIEV